MEELNKALIIGCYTVLTVKRHFSSIVVNLLAYRCHEWCISQPRAINLVCLVSNSLLSKRSQNGEFKCYEKTSSSARDAKNAVVNGCNSLVSYLQQHLVQCQFLRFISLPRCTLPYDYLAI